jgi:four helix bundle protein
MFEFQNLTVYQKSKQFHITCKHIVSTINTEQYVNDQLGHASYNIVLNIAEGSARVSYNEKKTHFTTARGSVFECVAILDLLKDEELIDEDAYFNQISLASEVSKLLYSMIKNLPE